MGSFVSNSATIGCATLLVHIYVGDDDPQLSRPGRWEWLLNMETHVVQVLASVDKLMLGTVHSTVDGRQTGFLLPVLRIARSGTKMCVRGQR